MRLQQSFFSFLLGLSVCLGTTVFSSSHATAQETILPGFDLYELGSGGPIIGPPRPSATQANTSIIISPFAGGVLFDIPVVGLPIGTYDFGDGNVSVGTADTIVRRLGTVSESGQNSTAIEILEMSLRSAEPVSTANLFPTADPANPEEEGFLYFSLRDATNDGSYDNVSFNDDLELEQQRSFTAGMNLTFDVRYGSPAGPLVTLPNPSAGGAANGFVSLSSDFPTRWSHFPSDGETVFNDDIGFTSPADVTIAGVNTLLDGSTQNSDFFLEAFDRLNLSDGEPVFDSNSSPNQLSFFNAKGGSEFGIDGSTPDDPILPNDQDGGFIFQDVPGGGRWFDPPLAGGFEYETTDGVSNFIQVITPTVGTGPGQVPDNNGSYIITSVAETVTVAAGTSYTFPTAVSEFTITDIAAPVDGGDPLAFPTFLLFDQQSVSFVMTPIAVPEPAALLMAVVMGIGFTTRRTKA